MEVRLGCSAALGAPALAKLDELRSFPGLRFFLEVLSSSGSACARSTSEDQRKCSGSTGNPASTGEGFPMRSTGRSKLSGAAGAARMRRTRKTVTKLAKVGLYRTCLERAPRSTRATWSLSSTLMTQMQRVQVCFGIDLLC